MPRLPLGPGSPASGRYLALAAVVYAATLLFLALWQLYVHPSSRGLFERSQLIRDDGGYYVAMTARVTEAAEIEQQPWFRYAAERVDESQLYQQWGFYAGRVRFLFGDLLKTNLYLRWVGALSGPLGSYEEAFYAAMLALSPLVVLKYGLVAVLTHRSYRWLLLLAMLLADIGHRSHVNWWLTMEAYAWHFFSAGIILLLAGRGRIAWLLLGASSLTHWSALAMTLALAVARVLTRPHTRHAPARRAVDAVLEHPLRTYAALGLAAVGVSGVAYTLALLRPHGPVGDVFAVLSVFAAGFTGTLTYMDPALLALVALVGFLRPKQDDRVEVLWITVVLTVAGVVLLAAAAIFVTPYAAENTSRFFAYVFALLTIGVALSAFSPQPPAASGDRRISIAPLARTIVVAVPLVIGVSTAASQLPVTPAYHLQSGAFPDRRTSDGCAFYLAADVQQVYGYFMRLDAYAPTPLVFELRGQPYDMDEALGALCRSTSKTP